MRGGHLGLSHIHSLLTRLSRYGQMLLNLYDGRKYDRSIFVVLVYSTTKNVQDVNMYKYQKNKHNKNKDSLKRLPKIMLTGIYHFVMPELSLASGIWEEPLDGPVWKG